MAAGDTFYGPVSATGQVAGTGALLPIKLDFKPMVVRLFNVTQKSILEFTTVMPQDSGILTVDTGVGTTDISQLTTNAITTGSDGFYIGTTAAINTAADVIYWYAERSANN